MTYFKRLILHALQMQWGQQRSVHIMQLDIVIQKAYQKLKIYSINPAFAQNNCQAHITVSGCEARQALLRCIRTLSIQIPSRRYHLKIARPWMCEKRKRTKTKTKKKQKTCGDSASTLDFMCYNYSTCMYYIYIYIYGVHACTVAIVHACTIAIVHACATADAHACTIAIVHAFSYHLRII